MPNVSASRVLRKFRKLHRKLGGSDRLCSFVKYTNAVEDYYKADPVTIEITTIDPQPVIKDQTRPRFIAFETETIEQTLFGEISQDQRIFIVLAHSFVPKDPVSTLSQRCEDFILERMGQTRGGIKYGNTVYIIERFFGHPNLGHVIPRYYLLGMAQKTVGS